MQVALLACKWWLSLLHACSADQPSAQHQCRHCCPSLAQDIIDRFVLSRTSEEVDLRQQRRDTKVCLYDIFNVI